MTAALGSEDIFRLWDDPLAPASLARARAHVQDLRIARVKAEEAQEHLQAAETRHPETLSREFVRNYYRYVDQVFQVRQSEVAFTDISSRGLDFEIYASSEYSRMLECEWAES